MRRAMIELVAERGIHGASMSQVAERAGVATGTTYVHYESKEQLLVEAFVAVKMQIGSAALDGVDISDEPRALFENIWRNLHGHLAGDPPVAHFLVQMEGSPLRGEAHAAALEFDNLRIAADVLSEHLVDLPTDVLYDLGLGPAVRLVASGVQLTPSRLSLIIESCWRAVTR